MDLSSYVSRHPGPGETLTSNSFVVSPGGKGANQAVACAKLSRSSDVSSNQQSPAAHVLMAGTVGQDVYGGKLKTNLESYGVDVSAVQSTTRSTGVAVIVIEEDTGQNRICVWPGANHVLSEADLDTPEKLVMRLGGEKPDLLIMQLEIPPRVVFAVLRTARVAKIPVLLNPAPALPLPDDVLAGLAHLVFNETEAAILSGADKSQLDDEAGLEKIASRFIKNGVGNVMITLGARGCFFMSAASSRSNEKTSKGLVPAKKIDKVVDMTAAGDTWVGRYALEVVQASRRASGQQERSFDLKGAVEKANAAAAITVAKLGAQNSIPWRNELE